MSSPSSETRVDIEYCGAWGYRPRAFRLKGVLDSVFVGLNVTPTVGRRSSFEVSLSHSGKMILLYSKLEKGRFPDDSDVIQLIKEHAKHIQVKGWYRHIAALVVDMDMDMGIERSPTNAPTQLLSLPTSSSLIADTPALTYCLSLVNIVCCWFIHVICPELKVHPGRWLCIIWIGCDVLPSPPPSLSRCRKYVVMCLIDVVVCGK